MSYQLGIRTAKLALALSISMVLPSGHAASLSVKSPSTQVSLLELYTSEGCSSCPPADRWVSSLAQEPGLWRDFIPVAFHVDYWDYIGWPDRFASPAYTARQRTYARQRSMRTIYTPGFFNNGAEWRWRGAEVDELSGAPGAGVLALDVEGDSATIRYETRGEQKLSINLALLGFGITTQVGAGENSGRTLTHDFVVLSLQQAPLIAENGGFQNVVALPETDIPAERYALVAWVSAAGDQDPLQAVGGWLM